MWSAVWRRCFGSRRGDRRRRPEPWLAPAHTPSTLIGPSALIDLPSTSPVPEFPGLAPGVSLATGWRNWYALRPRTSLGESPCGFESRHQHRRLPRVFSSPSIEARARSPQPVSLRRESRGSNDPRLSRSRLTPPASSRNRSTSFTIALRIERSHKASVQRYAGRLGPQGPTPEQHVATDPEPGARSRYSARAEASRCELGQ